MRILVADEDPTVRGLIQRLLDQWDYQAELFSDGEAALSRLVQPDSPRIALYSWTLTGVGGAALLSRTTGPDEPRVYHLSLIEQAEQRDLSAILDAGADDVVQKPIDTDELRVRLRIAFRTLTLEQRVAAVELSLAEQRRHDSLTSLWNRGAALDFLDRELLRQKRSCKALSLMLVDLDDFRPLNDQHGHSAGDRVLREVAWRVQTAVRSSDWVCRYGGDELMVILPGCDGARAVNTAERIRRGLSLRPFEVGSQRLGVSASFGVASAADRGTDADELVGCARRALVRAKTGGKNRVQLEALPAPGEQEADGAQETGQG